MLLSRYRGRSPPVSRTQFSDIRPNFLLATRAPCSGQAAPVAEPALSRYPTVILIVVFALDGTTSANCIRCEFATVCDPASPAGRKPGLSRAYESRGDLSASRATQVSDMAITSC